MEGSFAYFLARRPGRAGGWIRVVQWSALLLWLLFSRWIVWGRGRDLLVQSYGAIHGIFAGEVALRVGILPNWGLVTLALLALELWLQLLWTRCGIRVRAGENGWEWTGRRGPRSPERAVLTPGGAWLQEGKRWFLVSKGYVDPEDRDWLLVTGATRLPLFHWRAVVSPMTVALVALLAGAWLLQAPVRRNSRTRMTIVKAFQAGGPLLEAEAALHPDFRPWVRYLSTLEACDRAPCLRSQIADRLEMACIGPTFGGDGSTLWSLLLLTGRSRLAAKVLRPNPRQALDVALRLRRPQEARAILAANPRAFGSSRGENELLLMEEGRYEEAWKELEKHPDDDSLYGVRESAVVAHVSGHREEARAFAVRLLSPSLLRQTRLEGEAPALGMGALLRAVREVKHKTALALGRALLGDSRQASLDWAEAQRLADRAGVPGALERERIYMDLVAPGGGWGAPATPTGEHGTTR